MQSTRFHFIIVFGDAPFSSVVAFAVADLQTVVQPHGHRVTNKLGLGGPGRRRESQDSPSLGFVLLARLVHHPCFLLSARPPPLTATFFNGDKNTMTVPSNGLPL